MPTVKEVRAILYLFSDTKVTAASDLWNPVHVQGFVTSDDLKVLVEKYHVFMHSDGVLCVSD